MGGALQKKGVTLFHASGGIGGLVAAIASDPLLVAGIVLNMFLGGALLMVALSMGDGAKTGIFVGALSSAVFLGANMLVNGERIGLLHVTGITCAVGGAVLIGVAGLSSPPSSSPRLPSPLSSPSARPARDPSLAGRTTPRRSS